MSFVALLPRVQKIRCTVNGQGWSLWQFWLNAAQEAAQDAETPEKEETAEAISCLARS